MSYHAIPDQCLPRERTASDLRWAESWRKHGAEVARLLSNPDEMARFVASLRLLARRGPSSASACEESHLPARSLGTAGAPGLAL